MPSFWSLARRGTEADGATALDPVHEVEPVEVYTVGALVTALVVPKGQRLSDMLNSSSVLRVRDPHVVSYHTGIPSEPAQPGTWHLIDTDDILFVMPPEHMSARQLRVHRRQRRVRITTGSFDIVGTAHVPPGADLDPYVLRRATRFLALTNATAMSRTDPAWERSASVILVNVQPVSDLSEVITIA